MITRIVRGKKARGLVRYLVGPGRANEHESPTVIAGNSHQAGPIDRDDISRLVRGLEANYSLSEELPAKPVWHCSIRVAPGEQLSDDQWRQAAEEILKSTGIADSDGHGAQWALIRHDGDEHNHVHLVATLVDEHGGQIAARNDFRRAGEAARRMEEEFALTETMPRDSTAERTPSNVELNRGETSLRGDVRAAVFASLSDARSVNELQEALDNRGVEVRWRHGEQGEVTGWSFKVGEIWVSGSKLGRGLSWNSAEEQVRANADVSDEQLLNRGELVEACRSGNVDPADLAQGVIDSSARLQDAGVVDRGTGEAIRRSVSRRGQRPRSAGVVGRSLTRQVIQFLEGTQRDADRGRGPDDDDGEEEARRLVQFGVAVLQALRPDSSRTRVADRSHEALETTPKQASASQQSMKTSSRTFDAEFEPRSGQELER